MSEKIKFFFLFCEGKQCATFIEMQGVRFIAVMWAFTDLEGRATHETVYQQAIEQGYLSGNKEPVGGGVVDMETLEVSSSINYGPATQNTTDKFINYLRRRNFKTSCD